MVIQILRCICTGFRTRALRIIFLAEVYSEAGDAGDAGDVGELVRDKQSQEAGIGESAGDKQDQVLAIFPTGEQLNQA